MIINYYNDWDNSVNEIYLSKDFGGLALDLAELKNQPLVYVGLAAKVDISTFLGHEVAVSKRLFVTRNQVVDVLNIILLCFRSIKYFKKVDTLIFFSFVPIADLAYLTFVRLFLLKKRGIVIFKTDTNSANLVNILRGERWIDIFNRFCYRKSLKIANRIFVENTDCIEILNMNFYINEEKLFHVPNKLSRGVLRSFSELNFDRVKENIVVFIGRHDVPKKNYDILLRFWHRFQLIEDWKFIFITGIDLAQGNIVSKSVMSRGEVYDLLIRSKVLVNISHNEGYLMSVVEALYFGNVVYTTNVGGAEDHLINGRAVIIEDTAENCLDRLCNDLLRDAIKNNGNIGDQSLTWPSILSDGLL